ncbi:MAG: DUF805 domain-containing protein [Pseudomonadota bacterium]
MGPLTAIRACLVKSATFSGRASRSEFWWWTLIAEFAFAAAMVGLGICWEEDWIFGETYWPIQAYALLIWLPSTSVAVRRFHDIGLNPWPVIALVLLDLVLLAWPVDSAFLEALFYSSLFLYLLVLVVAAFPSQDRNSRYGPNPLEVTP